MLGVPEGSYHVSMTRTADGCMKGQTGRLCYTWTTLNHAEVRILRGRTNIFWVPRPAEVSGQ